MVSLGAGLGRRLWQPASGEGRADTYAGVGRPAAAGVAWAERAQTVRSTAAMNRARPTCPNGVTCQPIGIAASTRRTGTASGASARRQRAIPVAVRTTSNEAVPISSNAARNPLSAYPSIAVAAAGRSRRRQSVDLVGEQAHSDADQRLPCDVEENKRGERDPAYVRGGPFDVAQQ